MRLELTGRHVEITPAIRRLVDTKLAKLARLLNDSAVSAQAVLTREKYRHRAEVTLHARGEKFLHGVASAASWELSLSQVAEKLAQQAQTMKGKWQERKKRRGRAEAVSSDGAGEAAPAPAGAPRVRTRMPRILRTSKQPVRSMSVEDAARAVDASGDGVIVFRDPARASLSVLVRSASGELTLVETDL